MTNAELYRALNVGLSLTHRTGHLPVTQLSLRRVGQHYYLYTATEHSRFVVRTVRLHQLAWLIQRLAALGVSDLLDP